MKKKIFFNLKVFIDNCGLYLINNSNDYSTINSYSDILKLVLELLLQNLPIDPKTKKILLILMYSISFIGDCLDWYYTSLNSFHFILLIINLIFELTPLVNCLIKTNNFLK